MKFLKRARNLLREHIVVLQSSLNPVVALNSALRFTPLEIPVPL